MALQDANAQLCDSHATARKVGKDITRHIIVAVAVLGIAAIVWTISDAIVIGFGGVVMATVLLSLSLPLARRTGLPQRWSLMLVIFGLLIITALFWWFFGQSVAQEVAQLQQRLPEAVKQFQVWLKGFPGGRMVLDAVKQTGANTEALTRAGAVVGALLGATGNIFMILFLGIYFASDPTLYRDGAVRLVPVARRPQVKRASNQTGFALRKWFVAQSLAMLAVGSMTGVALGIMGVLLALSLGVLAGALEFIPVIGPVLSAAPGILLAFSQGPQMALYATAAYVAVQQIESNLITPLVQRWAVKLPPALGLWRSSCVASYLACSG